jgi:glutamate-ammonia-ligase adenylyltransferase
VAQLSYIAGVTDQDPNPTYQQWAAERLVSLQALSLPWDSPDFRQQLLAVIALSDYAFELVGQYPEWLAADWQAGCLQTKQPAGLECEPDLSACENDAEVMAVLRLHRHRGLLRILWRDINQMDSLEQTLRALSALADGLIQAALKRADLSLQPQFGQARGMDGSHQQLVVIGMGKLGGEELNFSSDIDLIFAFPEAGETDGPRKLSNEEYFTRLAQLMVGWLNQHTADGFVYRVDLRLRPFGEAGRIALSFNAMEQYYQREGRDWERYAWIKARPVAGDLEAAETLLELLRPFVYRRYLDYSAFEALREMKRMIRVEVERRKGQADIKLGAGGIREIEFIAQAFQMIRGGREPVLRDRRLRSVLVQLAGTGLLEAGVAQQLDQAYCFLRTLENRLQQIGDQQTHELPESVMHQARIAHSMKMVSWEILVEQLDGLRDAVANCFQGVFEPDQPVGVIRPDQHHWMQVWESASDIGTTAGLLAESVFEQPRSIAKALGDLRTGIAYRALGKRSKDRLSRFIPCLLATAAASGEPDIALLNTLRVVRSVFARSAYIALMTERPVVLNRRVALCGASSWLTEMVARQPLLLDELIDARLIGGLPDRQQMAMTIMRRLAQVETADLEAEMEALRLARMGLTLGIAAAGLDHSADSSSVARALTELAEEVLASTYQLAWRDIAKRYGEPGGEQPGMAVIAYGTLGGLELNFTSDLDLVFLYHGVQDNGLTLGDRPVANVQFFLRVAQRILHLLTTLTGAGRLYEVDARLRPDGNAGFLVSSLEAYAAYQLETAWTWELQALTRARWVAGDASLKFGFETARAAALGRSRDLVSLSSEVLAMRKKMRAELDRSTRQSFDLKQGVGGKVDIEFIAQWAVLRWAGEYPLLIEQSGTIEFLAFCAKQNLLDPQLSNELCAAYRAYRRCYQARALQEKSGVMDAGQLLLERHQVAAAWESLLGPVG